MLGHNWYKSDKSMVFENSCLQERNSAFLQKTLIEFLIFVFRSVQLLKAQEAICSQRYMCDLVVPFFFLEGACSILVTMILFSYIFMKSLFTIYKVFCWLQLSNEWFSVVSLRWFEYFDIYIYTVDFWDPKL